MLNEKNFKYSIFALLLFSNISYAQITATDSVANSAHSQNRCEEALEFGESKTIITSVEEAQQFVEQNGLLKNIKIKLPLPDALSMYVIGLNNGWSPENISLVREYLLFLSSQVVNMDSQMLEATISTGSKQEIINLHSHIKGHKQYYHTSCLPLPEQDKIKQSSVSKTKDMSFSQLLNEYKKAVSEASIDENLKNELGTKILALAQENKNLDFYFFKRRFDSGKSSDIDMLISAIKN